MTEDEFIYWTEEATGIPNDGKTTYYMDGAIMASSLGEGEPYWWVTEPFPWQSGPDRDRVELLNDLLSRAEERIPAWTIMTKLFYLHDWNQEVIADTFGVSQATVSYRISKVVEYMNLLSDLQNINGTKAANDIIPYLSLSEKDIPQWHKCIKAFWERPTNAAASRLANLPQMTVYQRMNTVMNLDIEHPTLDNIKQLYLFFRNSPKHIWEAPPFEVVTNK